MRHQPVQAGHAAVEHALDMVAHRLRGDRGLLGHRQIGGARADDDDQPDAVSRDRLDHDHSRGLVHLARQPAREQRGHHRRLGAGGEHVVVRLRQPPHDGDHLLRRLALTEDGLGHALAQRAVQIHAGEAQVLDGQRAEPGQRLLGSERAGRDGLQQRPYFFPIHFNTSLALPLRKPCRSSVT